MRQTPGQFIKALERLVPGVKTEVRAWPYPQAQQSHIAIWLPAWQTDPMRIPSRRIEIKVVNSDIPGALIRIHPDAPGPKVVARELRS